MGEVWATCVEGMGRARATAIQEVLPGCEGTSRSLGNESSIAGAWGAGSGFRVTGAKGGGLEEGDSKRTCLETFRYKEGQIKVQTEQGGSRVSGEGSMRNTEPAGPRRGHSFPCHRLKGPRVAEARDFGVRGPGAVHLRALTSAGLDLSK